MTTSTRTGVRAWLARAERDPSGLPDDGYVALLAADGDELDALAALADDLRRTTTGDVLTVVANRNLDTPVIGAPGAGERLDALVDEAWALGATEICVQGPLPDDAPADGYRDLVARISGRAPVHLHAFRPAEVDDAATRRGSSPAEFLADARAAGLGSVPGTAARILDDDVRAVLAGGPDMPVTRWLELIATAHTAGLTSTATMVYGHVETPAEQVAHLRTLATQQDRTGGFTEFIPMPVTAAQLPADVPAHRRDVARRGPDARESRAVHAVARLLLHGRVDHVQAAWTKLGPALTAQVLRGGADDLGGLLFDGRLDPAAGAEAGRQLTVDDVERLAADLGRPVRQRTTTYAVPPPDRLAAPGWGPA